MNKVILIGNLTKDPELSKTSNDVSLCKFSIAVNRDYEDKDGNRGVDYFNVTVWRNRADTCAKYLKKGNKVCVVGNLQIRNYEDSEGIKRIAIDVVSEEVEFLTPKSAQPVPAGADKYDKPADVKEGMQEVTDNQLPF